MIKMRHWLLALLLTAFTTQVKALQCKSLFKDSSETVLAPSAPAKPFNDVVLTRDTKSDAPAIMTLSPTQLVESPSALALKIVKHAIMSPSFSLTDKNFLAKDEIALNYPLANKYSLEVIYKSDSRESEKFIINEINLRSPTNKKIKVAEDLFLKDKFELEKNEFEFSEHFEHGTKIDARIPFFVEGKTIDILEKNVPAFELFSKEELRNLYTTKTEKQISRAIFVRKAKDVFVKLIVKQPFKIIMSAAIAFSVFTFQHSLNVQSVIEHKVGQIQQIELKETRENAKQKELLRSIKDIDQTLMAEEFIYTYKKDDGTVMKFKVLAHESKKSNQIDYKMKVLSEDQQP